MSQLSPEAVTAMAKELFQEERARKRLDGWVIIKEIQQKHEAETAGLSAEEAAAHQLMRVAEELPLSISEHALFAGTQRDAFSRSYALINPSFEVETFSGYCDPTAIFNDVEPDEEMTAARIAKAKAYTRSTPFCKALTKAYAACESDTAEVAYFVEQVTGHVIPDMRPAIAGGLKALISEACRKAADEADPLKAANYRAMVVSMQAVLTLADRYAAIAEEQEAHAEGERREQLARLAATLRKVPAAGASTLYEAIQSFMLLWMTMCIEQAPNPYAFSVGNADRIFEPYRAAEGLSREETAALLKHLLVFYNVADRSWAISQNLIVGGRDVDGKDLTNETSYALLDAYYDMNLPQPILSVKLHKNTPSALYEALGRFWFTPGCLTPSLFNDDSLFTVLGNHGVDPADLPDIAIAGCQEPLIMGKDNANTTNSWLNLGKILELTLNDGVSTITGNVIGTVCEPVPPEQALRNVRERFYANVQAYINRMVEAANNASRAVSLLPVPFLSTLMGGLDSGYDMRDTEHQGTKYNGSGCLIHGSSVVADSFLAIDCLLRERPQDAGRLLEALRTNFATDEALRQYLQTCPKYGNHDPAADRETAEVASRVADMVAAARNYLGNPFRPDFSSPSTHLTYGYWVGATPDGRKAREMLNYGTDPLAGDAGSGLGMRTLSAFSLPYEKMNGGYASHFGINPGFFRGHTAEEKGLEFRDKVIGPLFFNEQNRSAVAPFYLYVNVTTPDVLRKVLADPAKYAPSGVYIMRIHGTFVNFLDLSPAIQNDIIKRLDLESTRLA